MNRTDARAKADELRELADLAQYFGEGGDIEYNSIRGWRGMDSPHFSCHPDMYRKKPIAPDKVYLTKELAKEKAEESDSGVGAIEYRRVG